MKIVAIGGGEIGRPGKDIETESIDKEIIRLANKKHPKVLFIPTASGDSESYYEVVKNYFGSRLGCKTEALYLLKDKPTKEEIRQKIFGSDIVYVGGGNTLRMLKLWRKYNLDAVLEEAANRGVILSGVSAGAICWFRYGNSDSLKFSDNRNPLIRVRGLDLIPIMACPHYDVEKDRRASLMQEIKNRGGASIALENCTAIEIIGDKYRIITSKKDANAYLVYKKDGKVVEEKINKDGKYRHLEELLVR
jgi:dipeptidase E